jgi:uncharacterized protein
MTQQLILICLIFFVAAMVQGSTGFGFGIVGIALMSLFFDVKEASILLSAGSLMVCLTIMFKLRGSFSKKEIVPLVCSALICIPLGIAFLMLADARILKLSLSIVMCAIVIYRVMNHNNKKPFHKYKLGIFCGSLSGLMTGAFGTGGPPVVAYVSSHYHDKLKYVACVQSVLFLSAFFRVCALSFVGAYNDCSILYLLTGAVCAFGGAMLGMYLLKFISNKALSKVILIILFIIAVKGVFFSIKDFL